MTDIPAAAEGLPVVIEIEGADEATANTLRDIFTGEDEDVAFSHAFGGIDTVSIITTLGKATIGKLIDFFAKGKTDSSRTSVSVGKNKFELKGFSRQDIEALLASPNFQNALKATQG
jgi:hypothetical protein